MHLQSEVQTAATEVGLTNIKASVHFISEYKADYGKTHRISIVKRINISKETSITEAENMFVF